MSQTRLPGTPSLLRAINDRAALDLLLERGPLTRAQLGELTGLSKVTASQLVERLEERQLVTEVAERRYSRICQEDWKTVERRLGSYLLRRGFPSHLVRQALQHIRNKRDQEGL